MAEIDFEELDKAVNSLMNRHNERKSEPEGPKVENQSSDSAADNNQVENLASSNMNNPEENNSQSPDQSPAANDMAESQPEARATSPLVAKRQSGRFMDVVHPSSDMRSQSGEMSRGEKPMPKSRHANTLQPIESREASASKEENIETVQLEPPVQDEPAAASDAPSEPTENNTDSTAAPEVNTPMESPFLSDIEVNKRPLGSSEQAESPSESQESPQPLDPQVQTELSNAQVDNDRWASEPKQDVNPIDNAVESTTPPELSAEVMALESTDTSQQSLNEESAAKEGQDVIEKVNEPEQKTEVIEAAPQPEAAPVVSKPMPAKNEQTLPGNIATQYKSTEAEAPEPSAIFDAASTEPQPLKHPAGKHSGWSVLVWIVCLFLVGAVGGVLVWYFLVK